MEQSNSPLNMENKRKNTTIIIIFIVAFVLILSGTFYSFLHKDQKNSTNKVNNNSTTNEKKENNTNKESYNDGYVYVNDVEIKVGETKYSDFKKKINWNSNAMEEEDTRENGENVFQTIKLTDGYNVIQLECINDIISVFWSLKDTSTFAPPFDTSKTKLVYKDNYISNLTIGDSIDKISIYNSDSSEFHTVINDNMQYVWFNNFDVNHSVSFQEDRTTNTITNFSVIWTAPGIKYL